MDDFVGIGDEDEGGDDDDDTGGLDAGALELEGAPVELGPDEDDAARISMLPSAKI